MVQKHFNQGFPEFNSEEVNLNSQNTKLQHLPIKKEVSLVDKDVLSYPILSWRSIGNYEKTYPSKSGPGEYGEPISLNLEEKQRAKAVIKEFGFNLIASDKVSLDRLPKDLRHPELVLCLFLT